MALLLAILATETQAKPNRSGASTSRQFTACVQDAVLGRKDGECAAEPESEPCVGLRRALENSQKKTECLRAVGKACELWGHNGRTEERWFAIAAGHLSGFGACVKRQYGNDQDNGAEAALADHELVKFLKKLDDGAKVLKLNGSALLFSALREERFSDLIESSPFARERSSEVIYPIKTAADTPVVFAEVKTLDGDGSNPATEGETVASAALPFLAAAEELARAETLEAAPAKKSEAENSFYALAKNRMVASPRRLYSLGLDRTLFERVTHVYRRRQTELQSTDQILKAHLPGPPKDYSELLRRRGTL